MDKTIRMYKHNDFKDVEVEVGAGFMEWDSTLKNKKLMEIPEIQRLKQQGYMLTYVQQDYPMARYKGKEWVTCLNDEDLEKATLAGFGGLKGSTEGLNPLSLQRIPEALPSKKKEIESNTKAIENIDAEIDAEYLKAYEAETSKPALYRGHKTANFVKWMAKQKE